MEKFFSWVTVVVLYIGAGFLTAEVFASLWNWFMVPLGVHPLTLALSLGLTIVIPFPFLSLFTSLDKLKDELLKKDGTLLSRTIDKVSTSYIVNGVTWLFGFIVHHFV